MLWCPQSGHHSILGFGFNYAEVLIESVRTRSGGGLSIICGLAIALNLRRLSTLKLLQLATNPTALSREIKGEVY